MPSAVIVSAVRTAVGTARKGTLANTSSEELAATILKAVVERSGLDPASVDDLIFAESMAGGGALARHAAVELGMMGVSGMALNRHCAGSLSSVGVAAAQIVSGMERVIVAGGVQSASTMPRMQQRRFGTDEMIDWWAPPTHPDSLEAPNSDMSISVGWNTATEIGATREEMDAWAYRSHQRALAAIDAGQFVDEITPVQARMADGSFAEFKVDEHPRRDTTLERLALLKVVHPEIEGFSITAGNASGVNDGASALMIMSDEAAKEQSVLPIAKVLGWTAIGVEPRRMGMGAMAAIEKLLKRANVAAADVALWEINEAFAVVPLAACRVLGLDEETVNISGSGCSIGHPIAASGGRMLTTLIHDLKRRGGGLGVAAMCAGGGQAGAVLIEV